MGDFELIETGFSQADETINFGTRTIATENLFEISTLTCFKSEDKVFKAIPDIFLNCIKKNEGIYFSSGKMLKIFKGENLSTLVFNASFNSNIICMAITPEERLLAVCLETGVIKLIKCDEDEKFNSVFSRCLNKDSVPINVYQYGSTTTFFLLVFKNGTIFRIHVKDTYTEEQIVTEEIFNLNSTIHSSSFLYPLIVIKGSKCSIINIETHNSINHSDLEMKKISPFGRKFLYLDSEGKLKKLCALTLISFSVDYNYLLDDILVLQNDRKILAVTKSNELGEFFLQLLETDFQEIFSMKIKYPVHLVEVNYTSDDILFISYITNDNKNVTELRLQTVFETDATSRFNRLIRLQRWEEAEQFAKNFGINPSAVLMAKAQFITDKSETSSEEINTLISLMDSINDSLFNLQCCRNVDCSNLDDVKKILIYASRIIKNMDDNNTLELKNTLMDHLFRWETFTALSKNNEDVNSWLRFCECDLLEEVIYCLENLHIEDAKLIYSRLDESTLKTLDETYILNVLQIFNNSSQDIYQSFLPTFLPITMTHLPSAMPLFVTWLYNKIIDMENKDKANFPEKYITMLEGILKLIRLEKDSDGSLHRQCMLNRSSLDDLAHLSKGLQILQELKKDYGVIVYLDDYFQGPKGFISSLLKISLPPELYNNFLKKFLYDYMIRNDIDPDTIFIEEINNLLQCDGSWISTIEMILNNISSLDIKLQLTKTILLSSPVAWCDVTRRIAHKVLQFSHLIAQEIAAVLNDEPRYKVIKNPKYLIKQRMLKTYTHFARAVKRIIYIDEPQMIDDVFNLCKSDEDHSIATYILVDRLIVQGNLEQAMSVLDRNNPKVVYECSKRLFDSAAIVLKKKEKRKNELKKNYYEVLPDILARLKNNINSKKWESDNYEEQCRVLRGIYFFNHRFGTDFTASDFTSRQNRKLKYQELIEVVVRNLDLSSNDVFYYAEKIGFYLSKDKDEVILQLCDKIKSFDIFIKVGEYLYENESSARNLSLMTTLFLKYLGIEDLTSFNLKTVDNSHDQTLANFSVLDCEDKSSQNNTFFEGIKLGQKLISKALVKMPCDQQVQEVANWINTCFSLTRPESTVQVTLYPNIYRSKQNMPSSIVLRTVQNCYEAFVNSIDRKKDFYSDYFTFFLSDTESQWGKATKINISSAMETFCVEGQCLTAFSLLTTLSNSLLVHPCREVKILNSLKYSVNKNCFQSLVASVIAADHIDVLLLYNLLTSRSDCCLDILFHYLKLNKRRPRKLHDLSKVGIKLLDILKVNSGREVMENSIKHCKWWNKMEHAHSKIFYDDFFKNFSNNERLKQLISLQVIGMEDIQLYCNDFNLEVDDYYKEYLKSYLLNYKPDYEIIENQWEKRKLVMKSDKNELYETCQNIIKKIKDKSGILIFVEKMLTQVNFYHYEVIITIFNLLKDEKFETYFKDHKLLIFLEDYTRFNSPCQREKEEWYAAFPDTQILDPLSEFRLPFSRLFFTTDIWSILRPEINLKSYKLWFNAAAVLNKNLKIDELCVYAVKEVVSSGILGSCDSNDWNFCLKFRDLFIKVDECVQHINNLEKGTSVVYHLMNNTPNGVDKVEAAKLCMKYAIKYKEQNANNPDVEIAYKKVKNKYYTLSAWHILHIFNLADKKYIELVTQPEILIKNLYMDKKVSKQAGNLSLEYSYINDAVEALSELFDLDVHEIKLNLLNRWLSTASSKIYSDSLSKLPNNELEKEVNLKRAIYICTSGDQQVWQTYLLQAGMGEEVLDGQEKSLAFRANALKCFCSITDEPIIVEMTKCLYIEFLNFVDKLTLLSDLESLGISLSIETLDKFNKRDLLKKLSHMGKALAIKCMGAVCVTYNLDEDKYWEYIINSSIKLEMISELKTYVKFLKNKRNKHFYINAWQMIIDKTFQRFTDCSNGNLEEALVNKFLMIQSCPVVFSLNMEKVIEICMNLKKTEYAGLLLQYVPKDKRKQLIKIIFEDENILSKMNELQNKGLWGLYNIKQILRETD